MRNSPFCPCAAIHRATLRTNAGEIGTNRATVRSNDGPIRTNEATIGTNCATVGTNAGAIGTNHAMVGTNAGAIEANNGAMGTNDATAGTNDCDIATDRAGCGTKDGAMGTNDATAGTNDCDIATDRAGCGANVDVTGTDRTLIGTRTALVEAYPAIRAKAQRGVRPSIVWYRCSAGCTLPCGNLVALRCSSSEGPLASGRRASLLLGEPPPVIANAARVRAPPTAVQHRSPFLPCRVQCESSAMVWAMR